MIVMTEENEDAAMRGSEGITGDGSKNLTDSSPSRGSNEPLEPPGVSQCDHRTPGAAPSAGHEGNDEPERVHRHVEEAVAERPDPWRASRPEPQPFVQEKFRKTELHDTPPTPELRDRVLRKNSIRYLAGQVDSIQDRLDTVEYRVERAIARLDRRIEELEERWRWT